MPKNTGVLSAVDPNTDAVELRFTWTGADGDLMRLVDNGDEVAMTGDHSPGRLGVRYFPTKKASHVIRFDLWGLLGNEMKQLRLKAWLNGAPLGLVAKQDEPAARWTDMVRIP